MSPSHRRRLSTAVQHQGQHRAEHRGASSAGRGVTFKVSHDNGHAHAPGGGGRSGLREIDLSAFPRETTISGTPHPLGGIGELGAGVRECGYTPLLGAAKFFAENSRGTRLSAACRLTPTIARRTNYVAPWRGVIQSFLLSQFQIVLARLHSLSSTPL